MMSKNLFFQILTDAQSKKTASFTSMYEAMKEVAKFITKGYAIFDKEQAAVDALWKTYRKTGEDLSSVSAAELFSGIIYFSHCAARSHYKKERGDRENRDQHAFDTEEERVRYYENETGRDENMSERLHNKEFLFSYLLGALRQGEAYKILAAFGIKKGDFVGESVVDGQSLFGLIGSRLSEIFSFEQFAVLYEATLNLAHIDVDKAYYKLYNVNKLKKRKDASIAEAGANQMAA